MNTNHNLHSASYLEDPIIDDLHPKSDALRKTFFPSKTPKSFNNLLSQFLKYANIDELSIKKIRKKIDYNTEKHNPYYWDITWFHLFGLLASNFENHPINLLKQPSQVSIDQIIQFYSNLHKGIAELPQFLKNIIQKHPSYEYSKLLCDTNIGLVKLSSSCTDNYFLNLLGYSFNNCSLEDLIRNIEFQNNSMLNLVNQKAHPYSLTTILINANLYNFLLELLITLFNIIDNLDLSKNLEYLIAAKQKGDSEMQLLYFNLLEEIITVEDFNEISMLIEQPSSNLLDTFSDSFYYKESHKLIDNLLGLYVASFLA